MVEFHLFETIKKHGVSKLLFRYLRHLGFIKSMLYIFIPHFYIIHDNHYYDTSIVNDNIDLQKIIDNPTHYKDNNINVDDFNIFSN